MPNRAAWEPDHQVGHTTIDTQHQGLLDQCNVLADLCAADDGAHWHPSFDAAFERLKALAREHFETEATLLAGDAQRLEDHRSECEEFDYLVGEIVTADNFSRLELQRFLTLWCVGHVAGSAPGWRAWLASGNAPA
ncbi:hemerythrin [Burkholderiales bacterium JOSHI_001]|nr:hemerythrin [Burkholderiales bacterium JOSHI_001]